MPKSVRLRRAAADDIDAAAAYLLTEAGPQVAARFINATEAALAHVGRHPHHGTLRFSYDLDIPALRAWPLARFPYLVFYLERNDEIDVWRILHSRRDLSAALADIHEQSRAPTAPDSTRQKRSRSEALPSAGRSVIRRARGGGRTSAGSGSPWG